MPFFIGVDGGGSKTVFALSYADGIPITQTESIGCSYQSVGLERAADIIADGILKCTAQAGVQLENCVPVGTKTQKAISPCLRCLSRSFRVFR